jgi:hypothetical protein
VIAACMWRGRGPVPKGPPNNVDIVEGTEMLGFGGTPRNRGAQLLTRDPGADRTGIITLSWWPHVDHILTFTANTLSSPSINPKTTSTSNHSRPITKSPRQLMMRPLRMPFR